METICLNPYSYRGTTTKLGGGDGVGVYLPDSVHVATYHSVMENGSELKETQKL